MPDQAHSLRSASPPANTIPRLAALAVTGGKGGVGKTCMAVNLAIALAKTGLRPLLVDFDLGLANADVLLGIDPQRSLVDAVQGSATLAELVVPVHGIGFVPAASGHDELTRLTQEQLHKLITGLGTLAKGYDLLIIDTPAGIGREVMTALRAARTTLVVLTPDPTSMTDAYALIKVLETADPGRDLRILVNNCQDQHEAAATYVRLRTVVQKFLKRDLPLAGWVPKDNQVVNAVRQRRPFVITQQDGLAKTCILNLAAKLKGEISAWR